MMMIALLRGAAGGLLGTAAMSVGMLTAQRLGLLGKMPPKKLVEAAFSAVRTRPPEPVKNALSVIAHFGYGTGVGVFYAGMRRVLGLRAAPVVEGMAFGAAVWLLNYAGWIPALGIMPPPQRDREGRPASMFAAHLIFGGVLGAMAANGSLRLEPARERAER